MMKKILFLLPIIAFLACKGDISEKNLTVEPVIIKPEYAKGFEIIDYSAFKILHVINPWPEANTSMKYLMIHKNQDVPKNIDFDAVIEIPLKKVVVTSTTHIPALEALGVEEKLVGFPDTKYISSEKTRALINKGKIRELGKNESINTEVLLSLTPNAVIGFAVNGDNKTFNTIQKAGIPVLYNGDWTESHPLGKAEWITFFGYLFDKETQAKQVFDSITKNYNDAKKLAQQATKSPTVLSGSMYKDVWYAPYGNSWAGRFIADANGSYLWKDTEGSGSISLNIEAVLQKAQHADYWITTAGNTSKEEVEKRNPHYTQFDAFKHNNTFFASKSGITGGLLFYELGPNRPDIILKDLIKIFHPELLPDHELYFYERLK